MMTHGWLRSTTALIMVAGLVMPQAAPAQNQDNQGGVLNLEEEAQESAQERLNEAADALGLGAGQGAEVDGDLAIEQDGQAGIAGQGAQARQNLKSQQGAATGQQGNAASGAQPRVQDLRDDLRGQQQEQADALREQQQKLRQKQEQQAEKLREKQEQQAEKLREKQEQQAEKLRETRQKQAEKRREQQQQQAGKLQQQLESQADDAAARAARQKAAQDDAAQASLEQQARQAREELREAQGAAALTGQGELLDETRTTVTEAEARSSDEAFETGAAGLTRAEELARLQALQDDDDNVAEVLGAAAVGALGAYLVGQSLDGGGQVVANTGDRVVIEEDGQYRVIRDDNALLRRPGSDVRTQTYADGSTRTVIENPDGTRTVTIRAANGQVLRRTVVYPDGQQVVVIDQTGEYREVDVSRLSSRSERVDYTQGQTDRLRAALAAEAGIDRAYSLAQVRHIEVVRDQVPVITLDAINFATDSAVIQPREAEELAALGEAMREAIDRDPRQLFLVEGHTDTVGSAAYNLALSDRRAESVALALTEYFDVPPANMVIQGYGETDLKVERRGDIRANRRAAVRNITPLLTGES